jgi:pyruvate,water dikinase
MIINTKNATKILKNGQKITLNATDNIVYDGYLKELCYYEFTEEKFEETKEYRLLKRIYKRISPLNLVDPTGNNFRADNCKTFHDIIRFIHEKAVQELIDQNCYSDPSVANASIKLKLDIPLDLMVIDINQKSITRPRELDIHHISSLPLKYFVQGVSSENVWSTDPVGVDFKSFMSSMSKTFSFEVADPKFVGQNLAVVSNE